MFDLLEMMLAGTKIQAHGKAWIRLKGVCFRKEEPTGEFVIAVEDGADFPAPTHLIFVPTAKPGGT